MDEWLDTQGLYRKNTALDSTCLFRAVAEQLFKYHIPKGHAVLREQCVKFMRKNRHLFEGKMISGPFDDYLETLSDPKQWAGQLELEALSLIYGVDFLVFKRVDMAPIPATQNNFDRKIMLCFTPDNFYDAVYPKTYIENAGFCQSIVYGILYRGVFKLDDLEYAVEKMLHDKSARAQREKYLNSRSQCREECYDFYQEDSDGPINMKELLDMGAILFPYKVAKALDPDLYRNIDFDNWVDTLRVPRKKSFWFGNGGPLRVGVMCLLKLDDKCYKAHVQEMSADCGPVLVFVEELGEKRTVPFESLEPLPRTSLKPEWTFSHKHQIINKLSKASDESLGGKGKSRNKSRKVKEALKYSTDRKRDQERSTDYAEDNRSGGDMNGDGSKGDAAEPDSTTPGFSAPAPSPHGNNVVLAPCWPNPCRAAGPPPPPPPHPHPHPQPHIVKTVNLMVNKSVKSDCSDLPMSDLETVRFFFNLGIDYFRMGCLVWPGPPTEDSYAGKGDPKCGKTSDDAKTKVFKNQQKPPRFMKMGTPEPKPDKGQRSGEEGFAGDVITEPIPMAVPYTPPHAVQYPVQYRVPGYSVQPLQEPVPLEPAPITLIGYPDHYIEQPPYTIPYTVYPHPQYYYQN